MTTLLKSMMDHIKNGQENRNCSGVGKIVVLSCLVILLRNNFRIDQFYFLIINYDCLFEGETDLVLFNKKVKPICRRCSRPFNYASCNLKEYKYLGNNKYILTFYEGLVLNIKIFSTNRPFFKRHILMKNISKDA